MKLYPLFLNIQEQKVLIVGGGKVALHKSKQLIECGAHVVVVAPEHIDDFDDLDCTLIARPYQHSDLVGAKLVFMCTSDKELNKVIGEEALKHGIWCNNASDPDAGNIRLGAVWRSGGMVAAFSSGTELPMLSQALKSIFTEAVPPHLNQYVERWKAWRAEALSLESPAKEDALGALKARISECFYPTDGQCLDMAVVGVNYKTAPMSVRERVAVRAEEEDALYQHLKTHAAEVILLSTCNRTEVYFSGIQGDALSAFEGAWGQHLRPYLYVKRGEDALRHLYHVASGLDSLVLGETQILGQVKRAWQSAYSKSSTASVLNRATQGALRAGKRVRHTTGIADKAVSVSYAAVELAKSIFGSLAGKTALVVGAGETAELTLTHLKSAGIAEVIVMNRTRARAEKLAEQWGGKACSIEHLMAELPKADVVIASSGAPHYVIHKEHVLAATQHRSEPLFLIDISVPRILDPEIAHVENAYLYNLDDLTRIVERNLAERAAKLPLAEAVINKELLNFKQWHRMHAERERITSLQTQAELSVEDEVSRLKSILDALEPSQQQKIIDSLNRVSRRALGQQISLLQHKELEPEL